MSNHDEEKPLTYKNIGQLNEIAEKIEMKIDSPLKCKQYCTSANGIYNKADAYYENHDEENSYIFFMRYFYIWKRIKRTAEFSKSKSKYSHILNKCNQKDAISKLEELHKRLSARYAKPEANYLTQEELEQETEKLNLQSTPGSESVSLIYPRHWPNTITSYEMLTLNDTIRTQIEATFLDSIVKRMAADIISIEEVCNKDFYGKYIWKKHNMEKRMENINEQQLWHGTSYDIVERICHQNFDWRLCKSTSMYGQGCYFARESSYSHGYATPDSDNVYYMFLADVLVGEFAQGISSYKRPPEKETYTLYDSCVNNESDPTIFVIFERDQYYPRYLVKYKQKDI